jgi:hypothetical protein
MLCSLRRSVFQQAILRSHHPAPTMIDDVSNRYTDPGILSIAQVTTIIVDDLLNLPDKLTFIPSR